MTGSLNTVLGPQYEIRMSGTPPPVPGPLSETRVSGTPPPVPGPLSETRVSGTPPPVPGPLSETRVSGTPPPVPGPLSETRVSGTPPPVPGPLSETRVSGTPPPVPGPLSETRVSGTPPPVPGPLSETRVSGNQTMPVAVIISQGVSGPTAGMGFSEVSSHWGPGSPQSSLRHLTLPLGQRSPFSPCHTPTGHKTPVIMPVVPTNELCTSEEDLQGQIQAQGPVEAQLLGAEAEDASTPVASFPPDSSSSAAVDAEILFKQAVNVMTAELLEFLLHNTDHRGRGLLSPPSVSGKSTLFGPEASARCLIASGLEVPKSEVKKLLTLFTRLCGL
ncbi:hypothetical protein ABFV05_020198 [Capra hircus]